MTSTTPFLSRLVNEPHAVVFGGQSTPWTAALADAMDDPPLAADLHAQVLAADRLLTPVAADLLAVTGHPTDIFGFKPSGASLGAAADASVSVEGIALAQLGALLDAAQLGVGGVLRWIGVLLIAFIAFGYLMVGLDRVLPADDRAGTPAREVATELD